ncbi:hypothetical protein AWB91_11085 [Mycobacterium paraense]|uniref:PE domain-containing protein n=1 Tax=Mycobacterium paraense TaxID=767916 RepID=A0ABX3VQM2_9MYCO|nr:PE family protein [Mycobacterium paraense]ORW32488.1 hypothetical protein AWB91_11085 [Mycobacterium paraense]ORW37836.1 hypothetical protein AWB88_00970 [Mycobacterium paraense]
MSHVTTTPHLLAAAAGDLASVGWTIHAANANAAAGTAGVHAPGGDAVSAFVAALFAAHAEAYQAAGSQATNFHNQFVQALRESAGTYANAEAANASPLDKVAGMVHASAGHLNGNGAAAAQHGGVAAPVASSGGAGGPGAGNPTGGGPGPSGADAHPVATGGPQGGNGVSTGDGGAPAGGTSGGVVADPGGGAAAAVPAAWGPVAPPAPSGPALPNLATPPPAPPAIAGGYPAAPGLAGPGAAFLTGDSAALGGLPEPAAPVASAAAASPPAVPPIPTAPKGQPLHQSNPGHPGDAAPPADADHDKAAMPLPLLGLRLPSLRGFFRGARSGLRDKEEWREELREAARTKPWGHEELLGALGLRPPGNA